MMAGERADHTLNPSALLNEAFLKLIRSGVDGTAENRRQVYAIATLAMRNVLIDHARKRNRDRREGKLKKTHLDLVIDRLEEDNGCDFSDLYEAIEHLGKDSPRTREIVDLHFFGGLTFKEIASHIGLGERTVMREWKRARAKLYVQLANLPDS
jgi:RNA polymerase sigma factor (TIGR02999 family)